MKKCILAISLLFSCSCSLNAMAPDSGSGSGSGDDKKEEKIPKRWYAFFTGNAKEGAKTALKETVKELLKDVVIKPFLIKPITKLFGLDKDKKTGIKINFMLELAKSIDELKKAGASKKQIAEMSTKLAKQLNNILDYLNKKK